MHIKLKNYLTALGLAIGFSTTGFAHEAPVVDVQEMDAAATSTQPVASSGSGWQPVNSNNTASTNNANETPAQQPATQQWVSSQSQTVASSSHSSDSLNTRVGRLEQQMLNYTQMNLPQQVSDMQQKIATLQGQLEVDQRQLKKLTEDQKTYYQDLQQQISQLKSNEASTANTAKEEKSASAFTSSDNPSDRTEDKTALSDNANNHDKQTVAKQNDVQDKSQSSHAAFVPEAEDAKTYQNAFRLLSRKHFKQAHDAFKNYLQNYPKGQFAVNAYFWQGEIALMDQNYDEALTNFKTVVDRYPASNKVPDATLKIAMIHAARGETDIATKEFKKISKDYPGSTAAQLANIRLQQLNSNQ